MVHGVRNDCSAYKPCQTILPFHPTKKNTAHLISLKKTVFCKDCIFLPSDKAAKSTYVFVGTQLRFFGLLLTLVSSKMTR